MFNFLKKNPKPGEIWMYNLTTSSQVKPIFGSFGDEVRILGVTRKGVYCNSLKFPIPKKWEDNNLLHDLGEFLFCFKYYKKCE